MIELASPLNATLAEFGLVTLISPWKPLVLMVPFVAWAWYLSSVIDKHADRFHLGRDQWNVGLISVGLVAFIGSLLIPWQSQFTFLVSLAGLIAVLGASILVYIAKANKDERVPEAFRLKLFDAKAVQQAKETKQAAKLQGKVALVLTSPNKKDLAPPQVDTPEYAVRTLAESLFIAATEARASQLDLGPTPEGSYALSMLIDGQRQQGQTLSAQEAIRVMDLWKTAAGLDVADRRKRQRGMVTVSRDGVKRTAAVSSIGVQGGMQLALTIDPAEAVRRKPEDLGLTDPQLEALKQLTKDERGLVLVAAPPDGGRTTLLYTLTRMHDPYTRNIETVELDREDELEGVRQNVWSPSPDGPDFSIFARSSLRRDPQVVMVADMPDQQMAKVAAGLDAQRTRLYLGVRTSDALKAVQTFVQAAGDPVQASKVLHGVVAERLVRRLCGNCRQEYKPDAAMLAKLGLPADKVQRLYKKGGQVLIKNRPQTCPACGGSGYFGQVGIFECIPIADDERELIKSGNIAGLRAAMKKRNLPTMQQAALHKAIDGTTSVEEIMRVLAPTPSTPAGGGQPVVEVPAAKPKPASSARPKPPASS